MGAYVNVNDKSFDQEVIRSDVPVLVDFWAPWCAPCRAIAPHVEAIAQSYAGKAKVVKINIDESHSVAAKYGIRSIPTILIFKNGDVANQMVGAPPNIRVRLQDLLDSVL